MIPKKKSKKEEIDLIKEIENELVHKEKQKLDLLEKELKESFSKFGSINIPSNDDLYDKIDISAKPRSEKERILLELILKLKIPNIKIFKSEEGYIIEEGIQEKISESLKNIFEKNDIVIKYFELIKQITYISEMLKDFLKGKEFLIQWNITDTEKKYWLKLINSKFEYGEGEINNPSNIITTEENSFVDYIEGKILYTKLQTQGSRSNLILFEEFCSKIFPSGGHPLGYNLDERLIEVEEYKMGYEKEQVRKEKERKVLEAKEREQRKKDRIEKEKEKERRLKERAQYYEQIRIKIQDLRKVYDEIKINDIEKKFPKALREN